MELKFLLLNNDNSYLQFSLRNQNILLYNFKSSSLNFIILGRISGWSHLIFDFSNQLPNRVICTDKINDRYLKILFKSELWTGVVLHLFLWKITAFTVYIVAHWSKNFNRSYLPHSLIQSRVSSSLMVLLFIPQVIILIAALLYHPFEISSWKIVQGFLSKRILENNKWSRSIIQYTSLSVTSIITG